VHCHRTVRGVGLDFAGKVLPGQFAAAATVGKRWPDDECPVGGLFSRFLLGHQYGHTSATSPEAIGWLGTKLKPESGQ